MDEEKGNLSGEAVMAKRGEAADGQLHGLHGLAEACRGWLAVLPSRMVPSSARDWIEKTRASSGFACSQCSTACNTVKPDNLQRTDILQV